MKPYMTIEMGRGATYASNKATVYLHSRYGRGSVLAGQRRRQWVDDFDTLAEARAAYPNAKVCVGSTYAPPSLNHLPEGGDL